MSALRDVAVMTYQEAARVALIILAISCFGWWAWSKLSIANHPHPTRGHVSALRINCEESHGKFTTRYYQTWVSHDFFEEFSCEVDYAE